MATTFGSKIVEEVKRFEKAAKLAEATRKVRENMVGIQKIATDVKALRNQLPPKQ